MSADTLMAVDNAVMGQGEQMPFTLPRGGMSNKGFMDGDNVFGGAGFKPMDQRRMGGAWKGGAFNQGQTLGDLIQSQMSNGPLTQSGFHRNMGAK